MGQMFSWIIPIIVTVGMIITAIAFRVIMPFWPPMMKRDGTEMMERYFAWRAEDGGPLDDYYGRAVQMKTFNETTHVATGCYEEHPEVCGTMYGVYGLVGCEWVGYDRTDDFARVVGDETVDTLGVFYPWNPNGTMYTDNPVDGHDGTKGQWIMSVGPDDIEYCENHIPVRHKPWDGTVTTGGMDFSDDKPDFPEDSTPPCVTLEESEYWPPLPGTNICKRTATAADELQAWFTVLPHAAILDEVISGGADLMHLHMGNHSLTQAHTLFAAYHAILDKAQKRHPAWSLVRRGSLSADRVISALHKQIMATAYEEDRHFLDVLSNGAALKAVAKRGEAGKAGQADMDTINWMMDKIHGPVKKRPGLVARMKNRLPGQFSSAEKFIR